MSYSLPASLTGAEKARRCPPDNIIDFRNAAFIMASAFQTNSASTPGEVPIDHTSRGGL
jgi:hypothetical protein